MAGGQKDTRTDTLLEVTTGLAVVSLAVWLAISGWQFYNSYLLPAARVVPTVTPTPVVDPEVVKQEARRLRLVLDHVGAGISLRHASQRDAAVREFLAALALDPANYEARQNLIEMGIEPPPAAVVNTPVPPTPTVLPTITPRR
jgi:hypothetical protein